MYAIRSYYGQAKFFSSSFSGKVDVVDQNNSVVYNDTGKRYNSDSGHDYYKFHLEYAQSQEYANSTEKHCCNNNRRADKRIELCYHDDHDQGNCD